MVAGIVIKMRTGLTKVLSNEMVSATTKAHLKSDTSTPGSNSAAMKTPKPMVKILIK